MQFCAILLMGELSKGHRYKRPNMMHVVTDPTPFQLCHSKPLLTTMHGPYRNKG